MNGFMSLERVVDEIVAGVHEGRRAPYVRDAYVSLALAILQDEPRALGDTEIAA